MFTRQHYKAIAEIIKNHRTFTKSFADQSFATGICKDIARDLADYFTQGDPRFDRERFLAACGL